MPQPIRSFFVLALSVGLIACSDSSTKQDGDSGVHPDTGSSSDGELGDGAPHVPDQAAVTGKASAKIIFGGGPLKDAPVAFHSVDGKESTLAATDAAGLAEGTLTGGAAISALLTSGKKRQVFTVLDVQPGETIMIGDSRQDGRPKVTLEISPLNEVQNAIGYFVDAGCASKKIDTYEATVTLEIPAWCAASGKVSVMMTSIAGSGNPHSYAHAQDVDIAAAGATQVSLSKWFIDWDSTLLTVDKAPAGSKLLRASLGTAIGALTFNRYSPDVATITAPGTLSISSHGVPESFGTATSVSIGIAFGDDTTIVGESGIRYRDLTRGLATGTYQPRFNAEKLLPALNTVSATGEAGKSPTVNWSAPGLTGHDGFVITLAYSVNYTWHILAPPDVSTPLMLPALPAAWRDSAVDNDPVEAVVVAFDASAIANYAEAKADRGSVITSQDPRADDAMIRTTTGIHPPLLQTTNP